MWSTCRCHKINLAKNPVHFNNVSFFFKVFYWVLPLMCVVNASRSFTDFVLSKLFPHITIVLKLLRDRKWKSHTIWVFIKRVFNWLEYLSSNLTTNRVMIYRTPKGNTKIVIGLTWGHFSDGECAVKNKCWLRAVSSVAASPRHPTPSISNTVWRLYSVGVRETTVPYYY